MKASLTQISGSSLMLFWLELAAGRACVGARKELADRLEQGGIELVSGWRVTVGLVDWPRGEQA